MSNASLIDDEISRDVMILMTRISETGYYNWVYPSNGNVSAFQLKSSSRGRLGIKISEVYCPTDFLNIHPLRPCTSFYFRDAVSALINHPNDSRLKYSLLTSQQYNLMPSHCVSLEGLSELTGVQISATQTGHIFINDTSLPNQVALWPIVEVTSVSPANTDAILSSIKNKLYCQSLGCMLGCTGDVMQTTVYQGRTIRIEYCVVRTSTSMYFCLAMYINSGSLATFGNANMFGACAHLNIDCPQLLQSPGSADKTLCAINMVTNSDFTMAAQISNSTTVLPLASADSFNTLSFIVRDCLGLPVLFSNSFVTFRLQISSTL